MKAKLVRYAHKQLDQEYVVIITEGDEEEHCIPGYEARDSIEIEHSYDKLTRFPTDRPLWQDRE